MVGVRELMQQRVDVVVSQEGINWAKCLIDRARLSTELIDIRQSVQTALDCVHTATDADSSAWELRYCFEVQPDQAELAFEKILSQWRQELEKNPNDAGVMRNLSRIQTKTPFVQLADYDEALRCIQKVHQYSPGIESEDKHARDYNDASDYAWALYRVGRFDEAEQRFEQAERPENPYVAFGHAMTKARLGKLEEGRPYYELGVQRLQRYFPWDRPQYAVFKEAAALYDDETRLEALAAERWVAK